MLDSLTLPPLPTLSGKRVILRGPRDSDVDDRLRFPIDPEEEDCYGSAWRREWDGRRYHTREYLTASSAPDPRTYSWKVEYDGHCIGGAGLEVNPEQHSASHICPTRRGLDPTIRTVSVGIGPIGARMPPPVHYAKASLPLLPDRSRVSAHVKSHRHGLWVALS